MTNITEPLRLAVGSHQRGSGKGCAMNVISWENGDTTITDYPPCADRMLAAIVQYVNDSYCTHRDRDLLCPACSLEVLALAHRTVGTAGDESLDRRVIWVRLAVLAAREVAHLNTDPRVEAAIQAAETWIENPTYAAEAAAAADAAYAAYAAADAAYAANAANAAARVRLAHRLIDEFYRLAGMTEQATDAAVTDRAIAQMCTVA